VLGNPRSLSRPSSQSLGKRRFGGRFRPAKPGGQTNVASGRPNPLQHFGVGRSESRPLGQGFSRRSCTPKSAGAADMFVLSVGDALTSALKHVHRFLTGRNLAECRGRFWLCERSVFWDRPVWPPSGRGAGVSRGGQSSARPSSAGRAAINVTFKAFVCLAPLLTRQSMAVPGAPSLLPACGPSPWPRVVRRHPGGPDSPVSARRQFGGPRFSLPTAA